jgi:hypothetical protein
MVDWTWNTYAISFSPLLLKQFEEMIDRLEKGSGHIPVSLKEARLLLNQDDDLIVAVHTYWAEKRRKLV